MYPSYTINPLKFGEALVVLFGFAFAFAAGAADTLTVLKLPGGKSGAFQMTAAATTAKGITYAFEGEEAVDARIWVDSLSDNLDRAFSVYQELATQPLAQCKPWTAVKDGRYEKSISPRIYFLNHLNLTSEHDRLGYFHPENPGILMRKSGWRADEVERALLHEAVHYWCFESTHATQKTTLQNWAEEGLANFVAHQVSLSIPQINITEYFNDPCKPNLYGSSFLWWFALSDAVKRKAPERFLPALEILHLSPEAVKIHGYLKENQICPRTDGETPHAIMKERRFEWVGPLPIF